MYKKIVAMLDNIANTLQAKGYIKEAEELDIVSNTIEGKEAFGESYPNRPSEFGMHKPTMIQAAPAQIKVPFSVDPEELVNVLDNGKWVTIQAKNIKIKPTHS